MGSLEVYRQAWRLYWQTRSLYRRLKRLDCVRQTFKQWWADFKTSRQGGDSLESLRLQREDLLILMLMQVMLLGYEGQTQSFEVMQEQIEASQKQREVLGAIVGRWFMRGFYLGVLWLLTLLVSVVCLLKLQPELRQALGEFFQIEGMAKLAIVIFLLGLMEWLRRSLYVGRFSLLVLLTFDHKHLQPEEVFQCLLRSHRHEIGRAAGICCLADWLPFITGLALISSPNVWVLLLPTSLSALSVVQFLILYWFLTAFVILWLQDRVFEPFRYAVWAVVYSNWRLQHWR